LNNGPDPLLGQVVFTVSNVGSESFNEITVGYRELGAAARCSSDLASYDGVKKISGQLLVGDSIRLHEVFPLQARQFCIVSARRCLGWLC
jgi:hypothetical protein